MGLGGHASRCENIIKGGLNLNFHMVIKVAIQPQYLAALMAVLTTVAPPSKSSAMPLVYLNSNKGRLGLSNELQKST